LVVGVSQEPARRAAEAAKDLVSGLFIAAEREVGVANRTAEFDESHIREIGGFWEELERPLERDCAKPLSLLGGPGEGLEPNGGLPTGGRSQRVTALDQQPLAIGLSGDQRETRLRVEDQ
jgi:hypothetical protein